MNELTKCEVCQKPANQKCGGCHIIFYCTKEHQKIHWKNHKKLCRPFEMAHDDQIGRHFTATKDVKEGSVIFQEKPIIVAPLQYTLPVCVGCGNHVNSKTIHPCHKCGWPLCSTKCENNPNHIPECYYTVQRGEKVSITNFDVHHPLYRCVGSLRCLYQKQFAPDVWKKIIKLESHCKIRSNTEAYEEDKIYVAKCITDFFKMGNLFTEDEILKVCGIIVVNAHEIPLSTPSQVGLFNMTSIFEHSCRSNAYKTFSADGQVKLIAGTSIKKGDHVSICYTEPLQTTLYRKKHLEQTKFFSCSCERCRDVTEFGTNLSALKCQKGECNGIVLPKSFQTECSHWFCNVCDGKLSTEFIVNTVKRIGDDIAMMNKDSVDDCNQFLEYYCKILPSNHAYMINVKLTLAQLIGDGSRSLQTLTEAELLYKKQLCEELMSVIKIIAPAEKRVIGILLVEIYAAITELQRRKPSQSNKNKQVENPLSILMECISILRQAVDCLQYEPELLFEGKLCQQARNDLRKLEGCSKSVLKGPSKFM